MHPTVSTDPTPLSDMAADPAELNVIRQQFARFGSVCRLYAPLYRQVTLAGLRRPTGGFALSKGPQYDDVRDAWRHYLERDNRGRGVVLIGHSQGLGHASPESASSGDSTGKPVQSRLVSALLLGATFAVATGKDVGGSLQQIPLCRKPAQTGCVVTYVSFRADCRLHRRTRDSARSRSLARSAACTLQPGRVWAGAPLR